MDSESIETPARTAAGKKWGASRVLESGSATTKFTFKIKAEEEL
jgi:hypothetical protein